MARQVKAKYLVFSDEGTILFEDKTIYARLCDGEKPPIIEIMLPPKFGMAIQESVNVNLSEWKKIK